MRSLVNLTRVNFGPYGKKSDETKEGMIYLSNGFRNEIICFMSVKIKLPSRRRFKITCRHVNTFSVFSKRNSKSNTKLNSKSNSNSSLDTNSSLHHYRHYFVWFLFIISLISWIGCSLLSWKIILSKEQYNRLSYDVVTSDVIYAWYILKHYSPQCWRTSTSILK